MPDHSGLVEVTAVAATVVHAAGPDTTTALRPDGLLAAPTQSASERAARRSLPQLPLAAPRS